MAEVTRTMQEIDGTATPLGRIATRAAIFLRGKHKTTFTPHIDGGDYVRITNARRIRFTGTKPTTKLYHRFSGYPGGIRTTMLRDRWESDPAGVIRDAVYGMLPRNRMRARMIKRLTVKM
ncbi:MAG: 50S ribosomal protein L13 [bacterium]|nr:50S ribosomal protein L13 [bacterium]